jgi:hypothetical protein
MIVKNNFLLIVRVLYIINHIEPGLSLFFTAMGGLSSAANFGATTETVCGNATRTYFIGSYSSNNLQEC